MQPHVEAVVLAEAAGYGSLLGPFASEADHLQALYCMSITTIVRHLLSTLDIHNIYYILFYIYIYIYDIHKI